MSNIRTSIGSPAAGLEWRFGRVDSRRIRSGNAGRRRRGDVEVAVGTRAEAQARERLGQRGLRLRVGDVGGAVLKLVGIAIEVVQLRIGQRAGADRQPKALVEAAHLGPVV